MYCFSCRNDGWRQKETYYGVMKNDTTIDKMISEKDEKIEKNIKLPSDAKVSVKKKILL